jgi:hypothetical protein
MFQEFLCAAEDLHTTESRRFHQPSKGAGNGGIVINDENGGF